MIICVSVSVCIKMIHYVFVYVFEDFGDDRGEGDGAIM